MAVAAASCVDGDDEGDVRSTRMIVLDAEEDADDVDVDAEVWCTSVRS